MGNGNRGGNRRVGSGAVVGDFGDISVDGIGVVVDMLDPAVGKGNSIRALCIACTIARLGSLEIGCGVVVSNCIVVSVGGDFVRVDLCRSISRSWVGENRCRMDQRCSMSHRGDTMGNTMM